MAIGAAWANGSFNDLSFDSAAWLNAGDSDPRSVTTGTATNVPEATIVSTGGTVILTLTNDTWIAAGTGPIGTTAQSTALVQAMNATRSPTNGWNQLIRDVLTSTALVRTSDTVATITIPATAAYDPGDSELIVPVVQAAILTTSGTDINSSGFSINVANGGETFIDDAFEDVIFQSAILDTEYS